MPSIENNANPEQISNSMDPNWWRQAAVYQIYPRSFADANGDGIGDLVGITTRIPYLKNLGIDAVWLSPFYPSQLADGGYDVDDYRDVDPKIGTLAEFDDMITALHAAGLKLIVDIVPNHSSNRHPWFQAALNATKSSPERERYIFQDGRGSSGELPPNNWVSVFGGPAWERVNEPDGTPGQWYFHLFAKEQPDFNWDNPEILADFLTTLRFWSDRGVDGFRVDVAHGLKKDMDSTFDDPATQNRADLFNDGSNPLWDRDAVHEIYPEWRRVFNEYDPPRTAVAEAWVHPERRPKYASAQELGQAFNFDLLEAKFNATEFKQIVTKNIAESSATGASSTWVFSNHDVVRHATRYGLTTNAPGGSAGGADGKQWLLAGGDPNQVDRELGLKRARAATLFMFGLPGSAYLFQGEELGLVEVGQIPAADRQDPIFFRNKGVEIGRDGCRVPLPWKPTGVSFGFGPDDGSPAHLPQPAWFAEYAVSDAESKQSSTLNLYRNALKLRRELQGSEELTWVDLNDPEIVAFDRPAGWRVVTNFSSADKPLPAGQLLIASEQLGTQNTLPGDTTVWLRVS